MQTPDYEVLPPWTGGGSSELCVLTNVTVCTNPRPRLVTAHRGTRTNYSVKWSDPGPGAATYCLSYTDPQNLEIIGEE